MERNTVTLEPRQRGQKTIRRTGDLPVRIDQKGVEAIWPMFPTKAAR